MYEALILLNEELNPTVEQYAGEVENFYCELHKEKPKIEISGKGSKGTVTAREGRKGNYTTDIPQGDAG